MVESRIRIQTLNLKLYHHGKGTVNHLFGCLLSIGRIYSHMIFWAVILKDSLLPGATLGLGHHLPHQSSYKLPSSRHTRGTPVKCLLDSETSRTTSPYSHLHSGISQKSGQVLSAYPMVTKVALSQRN